MSTSTPASIDQNEVTSGMLPAASEPGMQPPCRCTDELVGFT
eukprot:CAMPEP_0182530356 /NCGR_PEP_ID=MMETSP1323-20130603/5854_1 /TAXON_ID=236787 /ORGANISM="Florenciella parvula, Strain RCC1693" /LENGTH=41 /DNA_ID= /DNA_START= /DNA_END= /DNA_ORIENTATION=